MVHKDFVLDYTSPLQSVIMEMENGNSDLTYCYSYAEQKENVVVYGVPSGPNSLLELQNYPTGPQNIVKLHYHHDRLGSIDYLTDNLNSEVAAYATYDDWGQLTDKVIVQNGVRLLDLVMEYTVHPYDQVLGLYYAKARIYDVADRRFMAVDPVKGVAENPATMVQYAYCRNNPLNGYDPFGLEMLYVNGEHISNPYWNPYEEAYYGGLRKIIDELNARNMINATLFWANGISKLSLKEPGQLRIQGAEFKHSNMGEYDIETAYFPLLGCLNFRYENKNNITRLEVDVERLMIILNQFYGNTLGWEILEDPPAKVTTIAGVDVYKGVNSSGSYIKYTAKMSIDADGSPHAYHPNDIGLDYLANAGNRGNWWGLATNASGNPYIQGENDPAPGYYVSTTSLTNSGYSNSDPRRYVDSETVAYIAIPPQLQNHGVKLGADVLVTNTNNGKTSKAIVADIGPKNEIGEGSIKLADNLGIPSNPKNGGIGSKTIEYKIYF